MYRKGICLQIVLTKHFKAKYLLAASPLLLYKPMSCLNRQRQIIQNVTTAVQYSLVAVGTQELHCVDSAHLRYHTARDLAMVAPKLFQHQPNICTSISAVRIQ